VAIERTRDEERHERIADRLSDGHPHLRSVEGNPVGVESRWGTTRRSARRSSSREPRAGLARAPHATCGTAVATLTRPRRPAYTSAIRCSTRSSATSSRPRCGADSRGSRRARNERELLQRPQRQTSTLESILSIPFSIRVPGRHHTSVLTLVQPSATVQPWAEQSASPRTSRKIFSLTP
jgi:hypothetical protein